MRPSVESKKAKRRVVRVLVVVGRLFLAAVLLFAAYVKLKPQFPGARWSVASVKTSLAMFSVEVDAYQLLPPSGVIFVADTLPLFELALGLWLLSGIALRYSSIVTDLLLAGFLAVVVRSYMRGLDIKCGCFGSDDPLGPWTIVRDSLLLAASIAVTIGAFFVCRWRAESRDAVAASPARDDK